MLAVQVEQPGDQARDARSCRAVPVMPTIGMRPLSPAGEQVCRRWPGRPVRGLPSAGLRCMSRPGPALTSTMAPPCSASGREMSSATRSMPAMSRPTTRAASATAAATSGWTWSVTSKATLPLRWISTRLPGGRHRVGRVALALRVRAGSTGFRPACSTLEREFFADAAARIAVDLAVDQLRHGRAAVAVHTGGFAARGRHQLAADHQQAVLVAADEALDHAPRCLRHRPAW